MMRLEWNWGTAIALVYTTFAVSTLSFVAFAMGQPVQLVSPDYYSRSLRQDERMAASERARALGTTMTVRIEPGAVLIDLPAGHAWATGAVTFYRPADVGSDRTVPLALDAVGDIRVTTNGLAAGRWRLQVEWTVGSQPFYYEQSLNLP
jgi:nitrogen fixation protein FixH